MQVAPQHRSEYHNGNEIGRYGRDIDASGGSVMFIWYHDGIRSRSEPTWAMDVDVEFKISISADVILVADATQHAVYAIDRDEFTENTAMLGGREQYIAQASDDHVRKVTNDPNDILSGHLWIESGNCVDEGYHQRQSEA